jgi:citrate synthase
MAESSRGTPFPERVRTRIWHEEPHPGNPFLAQQARCHGYALDEMARALDPTDTLFLLLRGELPDAAQHALLARLLVVFCNPGPRHAATRAVMNAAASGTRTQALPAIGLALLGGAHLGAAEVEAAARFIAQNRREDPATLASRLAGAMTTSDEADKRLAPGFGTLAGSIDPLAQRLAGTLLEVATADGPLAWAARFATAAQQHQCGWLMPGLAAAACCELGFAPPAAALIYQYAALPGLIAHALERVGKGITAMPFVPDECYELVDARGSGA